MKSLPLLPGIDEEFVNDVVHSFGINQDFARFAKPNTSCKHAMIPEKLTLEAGKNTYVYDAHTYHTKVPPRAISALIEHFTNEGEVVFDPFCGSGMTGVAAVERNRIAMLSDLSPAATFIAYHNVTPIDHDEYLSAAQSLLTRYADLENSLYATRCRECRNVATSLYTVWSYGLICSHCQREFVVWDVAQSIGATVRESKILGEFPCPHCSHQIQKGRLRRTVRHPVQIGYRCCRRGLQERMVRPDDEDLARISDIAGRISECEFWYPTEEFPIGYNTRQPMNHGIRRVDQAYTPRALWAMAALWDGAMNWPDEAIRGKLLFTVTSLYQRVTVFSEFRFWGGSGNTANFNVPQIMNEQNVFRTFARKAQTIALYFRSAPRRLRRARISTQSATDLHQVPSGSVDYVFTDPPFGANINYSEMNVLWESWLRHRTDPTNEAIINKYQNKGVAEYEDLLTASYSEIARVIKRNAFATIVFHNSSAEVWEAQRRAIARAGLLIEGTQTLDKRHGTFKQFVSDNAVGYDLILHCRRSPSVSLTNATTVGVTKVREFITRMLAERKSAYKVLYLHVSRKREFDYRRLYAEWLASNVAQHSIGVSFERFREICDDVIALVKFNKQ